MGEHLVMRLSLGRFLALREVQIIALLCAAMIDVVTVNAAAITATTTDGGRVHLRDALAAAAAVCWKFTTTLDNSRPQDRHPWIIT
jgi:hypothetical protein